MWCVPIMCGFPIFSMGIFASSAKAGIARPSETRVASATTNLFMGFLRLIETTRQDIYRKRNEHRVNLKCAGMNVCSLTSSARARKLPLARLSKPKPNELYYSLILTLSKFGCNRAPRHRRLAPCSKRPRLLVSEEVSFPINSIRGKGQLNCFQMASCTE
jgi:hypothetical protein